MIYTAGRRCKFCNKLLEVPHRDSKLFCNHNCRNKHNQGKVYK